MNNKDGMQVVNNMFWIESLHGVTLDCNNMLGNLIATHNKHSGCKAKVYALRDGVKHFVQNVNL